MSWRGVARDNPVSASLDGRFTARKDGDVEPQSDARVGCLSGVARC